MKMVPFLCGVAMGLAVLAEGASAQSLLVVNQKDTSVSVVDPVTAKQIAVVPEGTPTMHAHEVAVSADGRTAYLPIYGNVGVGQPGLNGHEMLVMDVPSRKITGRVEFGHGVRPHLPVLDPNSGMLYVSTELDKTITVINPKTLKIVGTIPTGQEESHMFTLSHDGRRGYTANVGPGTVSVLDIPGRKTITVIPVSGKVQRISISNDGKWVFTSDEVKPELVAIDTATNKIAYRVEMPGTGYGTASTKDGRYLLVALSKTKLVAVVDLAQRKVVRTIEMPGAPQEILVRPDGKVAYVSSFPEAPVAAIGLSPDVAQWKVQSLIAVGKMADGLAWVK